MIQELFHIGSFSISPFGVMMVLAFLAGYGSSAGACATAGAGPRMTRGDISRRGWAASSARRSTMRSSTATGNCCSIGPVSSGTGASSSVASRCCSVRIGALPGWRTADAAAPSLALGYASGASAASWSGTTTASRRTCHGASRFPSACRRPRPAICVRSSPVGDSARRAAERLVRVHPTQLYETALGLLIWGVGIWLLRRRRTARRRRAGDAGVARGRAIRRRVPARQGRSILRPHAGSGDQPSGPRPRRRPVATLAARRRGGRCGTGLLRTDWQTSCAAVSP